ncbi:hypothetical protein DERP_004344 [Dermatophagoides pteronyssinus]|uniref:Uncharacterized protein n=2 Tax=Dermatophagoides pteronyssinus TaxID=6956 RepID=A0ABQ8JNH3_DERPT|nr:hypothetical protein DERP_004344 [Dermatophagoides pteronyssinus]
MFYIALLKILIIFSFFIYSHESNCTGNCVESFRRKWPKFDFEFYYDQQNHSTIENESFVDFPYSLIDQLSSESTPKIIETITTTTTTIKPSSPTISNIYNQTDLSNCTKKENNSITITEAELIKTSFHYIDKSLNTSEENFRNKLIKVYEYGLQKQGNFKQDLLDVKIQNMIIDEPNGTIEIIYNLRNNGTLMSYEYANNLMTLVSAELIYNLTGFSVTSKIEAYNVKNSSEANTAQINWINLTSMLIILGLLSLLVFCIFCLYCCVCRKDREDWIENINQEISRSMPANSSSIQRLNEPTNWNSVASSTDDLAVSFSGTDIKKIDKSSQYDYSTLNSSTKNWQTFPTRISSASYSGKQQFIPVQYNSHVTSRHNSDYDRISYIHSRETIQETHKHPNILEIKLSEETQSIVKEIRKELDRYNQRKILNDDSSTSEA